MFQRSKVAVGVLALLGGAAVAVPVQAQTAERIEVTGSRIKRVDAEGPAPVAVITREEFEKQGIVSTNDLIRSLSFMSSFNDELTSNSPNATGTASAGFRGLGGDQTVVLLNGRRLANYGFDGAFVNLNTIPLGAIERVEVLKDGAAAIYGADAIGGVINFITRKDFRGAIVTGSYGQTSRGDTGETSVGVTAGFGNLDSERFNVLANLNYYKRDPLNNLDRERTRTADFRRFRGSNQLSTFAPTGNFVNPATGLQAPFTTCPDPSLLVSPSPLSPGVAGSASCLFDFAPYRTTLFGTERIGGLVGGRFKASDSLSFFGEVMFARSETSASAAPAPGNFSLGATNPANPTGVAVSVRGRPLQAGPRVTDNTSDATRILGGVEGTFAGFEYNVALGQAKNKSENVDSGYFLFDKMTAAINAGTFNPFSLTNPQSVIDSIKSSDVRTGKTTNTYIDATVKGDLFALPGGTAGFAAGFTYGKEEIADIPGPNSQIGNIFGSIQQSPVTGERKLGAVYAEVAAPITKQLEAQFAVRHDRYSGGTKSTTPKVALRYQPSRELLMRASYSEGFKMPSLRDLFGGKNQSADSVQDFPGCAANNVTPANCPRLQYDRFSGGNAQLKPEKAKSATLGLLLEPNDQVSLGMDYFIINKTDEIGLVLTQFVIDNVAYVPGATTTLGGNPAFAVTRNAGGTITRIDTSLGNLGERKIQGFDLYATLRFPTAIGRLTVDANGTYFERYQYADQPGTPLYNRAGLLNLPRWRSKVTASMESGDFNYSASGNFRAKFFDKPQSTAATPVASTTALVGNYDTFDLQLGYKGVKGLRINVGVRNVFDKEPPFANNDPRTLGFAQTDDILGRNYFVNASYSF